MSKIICPRCHVENASGMAFCTNCGQAFAAPAQNFPPVNPSQMPTASLPAVSPAPAKSSRSLLYGLLGCGGLLAIFVVGAFIVGIFIKLGQTGENNTNSSNVTAANTNSNYANNNSSPSNSTINNSNDNSIEQVNSSALDEVRSLKQVGAFRQTEVKDVPAGDYYPSAGEAVQVTYQNGKQTVAAIVAQFASSESALADFDARIKGVKENGGKLYNNMNKSGTRGAAYKFKEYYYIEVCGEAICWRNYSSELNAVRTFAVNFPNGSNRTKK